MRILTGKYKGKNIQMPKGIRPTQNKVRKAIFDILGDIEGMSFLELFAGSGSVSFEAISRGVKELTLVEYNPDCLQAIKKNIESLQVKACSVYPKEAFEAIKALHNDHKSFDIIFIDPPYYKKASPCQVVSLGHGTCRQSQEDTDLSLTKKTLQTISGYDILAPNGFVIAQHSKKENLPEALGDLSLLKQAIYGDTWLSFYRKAGSKSR